MVGRGAPRPTSRSAIWIWRSRLFTTVMVPKFDDVGEISGRSVGRGVPRPWGFYILSGGGSANELLFVDVYLEFLQEFGVLGHFLAEQSDQIQAGGPVRFAPPFGKGLVGGPTFGAEGDQGCQQEGTISGNRQHGLLGHGVDVPQLGLSYSQGILLVP